LDQRKHKARRDFDNCFEHFEQPKNRQLFKDLFAPHA
jgi:hypothetical protein